MAYRGRDGALVTLKLRHVDLEKQLVDQDPREVKTKNSKQLRTTFFGVGGSARGIVEDWIAELRSDHFWGNDDPCFLLPRSDKTRSGSSRLRD